MWSQIYDPLNNFWLSTALAAIPVVVLLGALGVLQMKAHVAALLGLVSAPLIAILVFGMPVGMAGRSAFLGALFGLLPIGWIVLNIIFLYQLTEQKGEFTVLKDSITGITTDRRLQLLLIAFCFGAFFEGAAGFGTPVAVTGAILIGLGFSPLAASGLSLIANTAPVAFGALGTPILTLASVHGYDANLVSAMVGRQLPFFSLLVPFWLIWAFVGFRGMLQIWPAVLVAGVSFAIPQFVVSNFHGPTLVDIIAALVSMTALAAFLRVWHPKEVWHSTTRLRSAGAAAVADPPAPRAAHGYSRQEVLRAWTPWVILSVLVFIWGLPEVRTFLNGGPANAHNFLFGISAPAFPIEGLHQQILRMPPVVTQPTPEGAVYTLNWLSATGTGVFLAAVIAGFVMGYSPGGLARVYWQTLVRVRYSLLTIAAMLALGFTTRLSGLDTTLGLAFAQSGFLYPFFGTLLGWMGVALTGSDTSSNVLFGGLQKVSAMQLGLSPTLMGAANSSGGVMGKMIDAQSIVVAATATNYYGKEGEILRYVFFHSLALACLVGGLVMLQAYVWPFTAMVVGG